MSLDYKSAGVDKEAGYDTVARIKQYAGATHNARVLGQIGAFGAFYDLSGYRHPILVSGTDGVGTKLKIAFALGKYDTIGAGDEDGVLVAAQVVKGAEGANLSENAGVVGRARVALDALNGVITRFFVHARAFVVQAHASFSSRSSRRSRMS